MGLTKLQQNAIDTLKYEMSFKDEMNNLKDTVIKYLQNENQNLRHKCNKLETKIV